MPGGNDGGTNWDRGIYQVAQSTSTFDVVGRHHRRQPDLLRRPVQGPGNRTRFREVENGIFSANAIKAENTEGHRRRRRRRHRQRGSGHNLRSISGPTLDSDYYQTDRLRGSRRRSCEALALGNCLGSITVVKQVVPSPPRPAATDRRHSRRAAGRSPEHGSAGVSFDAPTSRMTAAGTGAANFPLTFTGGTTTGTGHADRDTADRLHPAPGRREERRLHQGRHRRASAGHEQRRHRLHRRRRTTTYPGQLHRLQQGTATRPPGRASTRPGWSTAPTYAEGSQPPGLVAAGDHRRHEPGRGGSRGPASRRATVSRHQRVDQRHRRRSARSTRSQVVLANGATRRPCRCPTTPTLVAGAEHVHDHATS